MFSVNLMSVKVMYHYIRFGESDTKYQDRISFTLCVAEALNPPHTTLEFLKFSFWLPALNLPFTFACAVMIRNVVGSN